MKTKLKSLLLLFVAVPLAILMAACGTASGDIKGTYAFESVTAFGRKLTASQLVNVNGEYVGISNDFKTEQLGILRGTIASFKSATFDEARKRYNQFVEYLQNARIPQDSTTRQKLQEYLEKNENAAVFYNLIQEAYGEDVINDFIDLYAAKANSQTINNKITAVLDEHFSSFDDFLADIVEFLENSVIALASSTIVIDEDTFNITNPLIDETAELPYTANDAGVLTFTIPNSVDANEFPIGTGFKYQYISSANKLSITVNLEEANLGGLGLVMPNGWTSWESVRGALYDYNIPGFNYGLPGEWNEISVVLGKK